MAVATGLVVPTTLYGDDGLLLSLLSWVMPHDTVPEGQGDGLEIHWALPAGARTPSVSLAPLVAA